MYYLKTEASFDSAHFLADYQGKCHNIHGHRWNVEVCVCGEQLAQDAQQRGMLVDFAQLKTDLRALAEQFDHALIYEAGSLRPATLEALRAEDFSLIEVPFRPTAEQFAREFYDRMTALGYQVHEATVYETPTNCASYGG